MVQSRYHNGLHTPLFCHLLDQDEKEVMMTPEEKFIFDLDGYLVVKNVLSHAEVDALNALADEAWPGEYDENNMRRTDRVSRWGPASQALLDHPNALPYMVELLGPKVRIDHDYCIFMQKGGKAGRLHGGQTMQGGVPGDHWYKYHDGMIRNGLTVFTYCLTHADSGDGGFGCIPGSHKSNFTVDIPAAVRCHERPAHYVRQVAVKAGDLIIFTEALVHGTMEWTAAHERRTLLYKRSPGYLSWASIYYDVDDYLGATERQKRMLAPPSVGNRPDTVDTGA